MLIAVILIGTLVAPAAWAQSAPGVNTSGWTIYRNESMRFEARHPAHWRVSSMTGTAPENVVIGEPRQADTRQRAIQFWVQRHINPKGLGIADWYADELKRMPPDAGKGMTVKNTVIGGRPAVRREATGTIGRSVHFFIALNRTDVFQITISQPASQTELDPTIATLLSTLAFID